MPTKPITINPKPTPGTLTHELAHVVQQSNKKKK
jgi:hypothetical protein